MQIDFSDKRVIAAAATAGIVAAVIIVLQSLILMGSRPAAVTYSALPSAQPHMTRERSGLLKELLAEHDRTQRTVEECMEQNSVLVNGVCKECPDGMRSVGKLGCAGGGPSYVNPPDGDVARLWKEKGTPCISGYRYDSENNECSKDTSPEELAELKRLLEKRKRAGYPN